MRKRAPFVILALMTVARLNVAAPTTPGFYLKNGDRVVFYGDSITDQRLYTTFAETFVVTRFPKMNVQFVHSGWGGDRVGGGGGGPIDHRLTRDVFAYRPTVMTIMLGMNDGSYRPFDQGIFDTYSKGYIHILDSLKKTLPGLRLTLIQPSPYDDVTREPGFPGGYNAVLIRYGEFVKDLAQKNQQSVADLNTSVVDAVKKANATDHATALKIIADRVHPGPGGHLLMAAALLKAWNAPSLVASAKIDCGNGRLTVKTQNCKLTATQSGNGLEWTQTDGALPMPMDMNDPALDLAVRSSDLVETLNQQPLKVTGLKPGKYVLKIDGDSISTLTSDELAHGVNLATRPTPMSKQAMEVHALTLRHNQVHFFRWRTVQVPMQNEKSPHMAKALAELDAMEAEVVKAQREAAQPKPHRFELVPQ